MRLNGSSRWIKIEEKIEYLSVDEMIEIHEEIINESGGEGGILYEGDLEFISDFLNNDIDLEAKEDLFKGAAKLLYWIISGHPFIDGNKRAGIECADIFLRKNGFYLDIETEEGIKLSLKVAKDEMSVKDIEIWLKNNARKD